MSFHCKNILRQKEIKYKALFSKCFIESSLESKQKRRGASIVIIYHLGGNIFSTSSTFLCWTRFSWGHKTLVEKGEPCLLKRGYWCKTPCVGEPLVYTRLSWDIKPFGKGKPWLWNWKEVICVKPLVWVSLLCID